jgi:hypothetical protein
MMKKMFLATSLLLTAYVNSQGQWYVKNYNVTDINFLSREQLEESLKTSKSDLLYSGIISVAGGGIFLAGRYLPYEINEESSFIEQLFGEKGMKDILKVSGAGILAGGAIAGIVYLGRIVRIRSIINKYYASAGSLNISPAIIPGYCNKTVYPGLTITYNF